MSRLIKKILKKGLRIIGYDIHRIQLNEDNKYIWLQDLGIKTIIDIGSNDGGFVLEIEKFFSDVDIYSFEPLKDVYAHLIKKTAHLNKYKAFNVSLGDRNGTVIIKRNKFSPSSSLLDLGLLHKEAFPFAMDTWEEEIKIKRLDDLITENDIILQPELLIKIDVQGFEDRVLAGGSRTISKAKVLIIEVSFQELYKGQQLFDGIYGKLKDMHFGCKGFYTTLYHPKTGLPLSSDAIFVR